MKLLRHILFFGALLSLSACATMGRHASKSAASAARATMGLDSLFGPTYGGADTASLAAVPWREFFTDPYLQALIDSGLRHNADLRIASLRVVQAEAALRAAVGAFAPALSVGPQGELSGFGRSAASKTYKLALSADWELDLSGRLQAQKRGAAAAADESRAYRQAVRTQLIATIAGSYYNLLMLDAQLRLSREAAQSWAETVRALSVQKQVGLANEAAVAQAEANRLQVEGTALGLQRSISEQENALCTLVGTTPRRIARGTLSDGGFPERLATGVPLQLLDNRPDIRQACHALQRACHATQAARAAFYPQLTLSGLAGWSNTDGSTLANPGRFLWNALASLTQPLLSHGRNRAALETARAQEEEALTSFRQSLLNAGAEVNNALTQWQTARRQIATDSSRIASLRNAVRTTQMLMRHSDSATYLEVLTAQQALLEAELGEKQDLFAKIQGVINLYHALGGGE